MPPEAPRRGGVGSVADDAGSSRSRMQIKVEKTLLPSDEPEPSDAARTSPSFVDAVRGGEQHTQGANLCVQRGSKYETPDGGPSHQGDELPRPPEAPGSGSGGLLADCHI